MTKGTYDKQGVARYKVLQLLAFWVGLPIWGLRCRKNRLTIRGT